MSGETKICENCGEKFETLESGYGKSRKYCSAKCATEAATKRRAEKREAGEDFGTVGEKRKLCRYIAALGKKYLPKEDEE